MSESMESVQIHYQPERGTMADSGAQQNNGTETERERDREMVKDDKGQREREETQRQRLLPPPVVERERERRRKERKMLRWTEKRGKDAEMKKEKLKELDRHTQRKR